jgi:AraC-binding-like domain
MRRTIRIAPEKAGCCTSISVILCSVIAGDDRPGVESTMRTRNLDEAIDAVTKVYCPHTVEVVGPVRDIDALLEVDHPTSQPLVTLSYNVPVKIDALNFSRLFLMMHCQSGAAAASQEHHSAEWRKGQAMPFSAGLHTQLWFDRAFVQRSVRLDMDRLEAQCARWLGHPLEQPLRFALRPFSDELEQIWRRTLFYLWSSEEGGLPLPSAAKAACDEYLLTLLLHYHPTITARKWRSQPRHLYRALSAGQSVS